MKNIIVLCMTLPLISNAAAPNADEMALYNAITHGANVLEHIQVVDQDGVPVENAKLWGSLQTGDGYNDYISIEGYTNANGEYTVKDKCNNRLTLRITKAGYYKTDFELSYRNTVAIPKVKDGKWQPYGYRRQVSLKKIIAPVNLIHPNPKRRQNPDVSAWHGYDLEQCEWLPPHGSGRHADMLVRINVEASASHDFKAFMEISFTNNPFAGAYLLKKDPYSEMKSIYKADTNAIYQTSLEYLHEEHPIIHRKPIVYVQGLNKTDTRLDRDSYLVFRTRTKIDNDGNLVSAHYGKIYGPWEIFRAMHAYGVYFNPKENDNNLEDIETAEHSRMLQRQREENEPSQKKKLTKLWPF